MSKGEYLVGEAGNPANNATSAKSKSFTFLLKIPIDAACAPHKVPPYGV